MMKTHQFHYLPFFIQPVFVFKMVFHVGLKHKKFISYLRLHVTRKFQNSHSAEKMQRKKEIKCVEVYSGFFIRKQSLQLGGEPWDWEFRSFPHLFQFWLVLFPSLQNWLTDFYSTREFAYRRNE